MKECLGVLHLLSGEWSSILQFTKINTWWNILLPVGEGTAILRTSVIPGIPEHSIDEFKWMLTSSVNFELSLITDQHTQTSACTHQL